MMQDWMIDVPVLIMLWAMAAFLVVGVVFFIWMIFDTLRRP